MRGADPWLLLAGFVIFYCTFPLRALRWRMLLENADVPVREGRNSWASLPALMEYIYLSWFANCVVPAKLGDAYRGYLLKHNGKVSFSATFGTIFAERLLDMIGLFGLLVVSAWVTFGPHMPPGHAGGVRLWRAAGGADHRRPGGHALAWPVYPAHPAAAAAHVLRELRAGGAALVPAGASCHG